MFVRIKTSPNTKRTSVQIVKNLKVEGKVKQKIIRHVGSATDKDEIEELKNLAEYILLKIDIAESKQLTLFSPEEILKIIIESRSKNNKKSIKVDINDLREEQRVVVGIHEVYGQVYQEIGFDKVFKNPVRNKGYNEKLFNLVMARIANPDSKRGSVNNLEKNFGVSINLDSVYRMMDKLNDKVIDNIQEIAFRNAQNLLNQEVDAIFYDATTLYFESFTEDGFREKGYSKDMKFNQTQVLLALLVTKEGLPIGYELYPGSKYEGSTLSDSINKVKTKYKINNIVFVADSGLLNKDNLDYLEKNNYKYIVGARIKNNTKSVREKILKIDEYSELTDDLKYKDLENDEGRRLIVSHSIKRAKKDEHDRNTTITKLIKKLEKTEKPESLISNYGYKKFLNLKGDCKIELNEEKIKAEKAWDGLHGVISNVKDESVSFILSHYKNLWKIEETFRISKHDLKIRPIYHYAEDRIKAHIAICFIALCCVRNLEYRVSKQQSKLSVKKIRDELLSFQASILKDISTDKRYCIPSIITEEVRKIYKVIGINITNSPFELI